MRTVLIVLVAIAIIYASHLVIGFISDQAAKAAGAVQKRQARGRIGART